MWNHDNVRHLYLNILCPKDITFLIDPRFYYLLCSIRATIIRHQTNKWKCCFLNRKPHQRIFDVFRMIIGIALNQNFIIKLRVKYRFHSSITKIEILLFVATNAFDTDSPLIDEHLASRIHYQFIANFIIYM